MQTLLASIGYEIAISERYDEAAEACVRAFQRRWVQDRVSGSADLVTLQRIGIVEATYRSAHHES